MSVAHCSHQETGSGSIDPCLSECFQLPNLRNCILGLHGTVRQIEWLLSLLLGMVGANR